MTVPYAAIPCDKCHGTGTVPHEKRKIADGAPDPHDYQLVELCDKCGGAGVLRSPPPRNLPEPVIA